MLLQYLERTMKEPHSTHAGTPRTTGVAVFVACPTFQINAHHEIGWQVQLNVLSNLLDLGITNYQSEMVEILQYPFLVIFGYFWEMASLLILVGFSIISHPF